VVNVTVDQSTNLVVNPASLSIPANGAKSFTVKLAKAPTGPVTVTVTTSTPDLTTTPASLVFSPANFDINQTVLVSAGLEAVPGAQSVLLDAGPLGQFKLPVTITPISKTTFFIDPTNGNDAFPGTAALPWKTVKAALDSSQDSGSTVKAAANAGNTVVITILGGTYTEEVGGTINTPALSAGSVTVLQAPSPKTFTLNMNAPGSQLILNKGYKLQDIKITSNVGGGSIAVKITHPTAGLASVEVKCVSSNVICVKVEGAGFHTLRDVTVDVKDDNPNNIGILSDANANLSIVGGIVKLTAAASGSQQPITLIQSNGVLTATGLTVDMVDGSTNTHAKDSKGIVLNASGSSVTGSTIYVNNGSTSTTGATGIKVNSTANPSTVKGSTFIGSGSNSFAINGASNLFSGVTGALVNNNFSGSFGSPSVKP
jgi:hypothetical protein